MDNLTLNAEVLTATADIITVYTNKQKQIMRDYLSKIIALIPNWNDDETFSPLISEINKLKNEVTTKMEIIESTYPSYFRAKAESISSRPAFESTSYSGSTSNFSSSGVRSAPTSVIMATSPISSSKLNEEMCLADGVGTIEGYVRTSSNGRRISELNNVGTFMSPQNGEPIYCKTIAWRSQRSVEESNSYNVCGADFYYADGSYCGSYTGKNWQDIYDNNVADTKKFRK